MTNSVCPRCNVKLTLRESQSQACPSCSAKLPKRKNRISGSTIGGMVGMAFAILFLGGPVGAAVLSVGAIPALLAKFTVYFLGGLAGYGFGGLFRQRATV